MPVGVVHRLEAVEVDQQQCQARTGLEAIFHALLKKTPVRDARQRILPGK
jgi:hypothetical protein